MRRGRLGFKEMTSFLSVVSSTRAHGRCSAVSRLLLRPLGCGGGAACAGGDGGRQAVGCTHVLQTPRLAGMVAGAPLSSHELMVMAVLSHEGLQ